MFVFWGIEGQFRFVGWGLMEVRVRGLCGRNTEVRGLGTVWLGKGKGKG